jgi:hypothetical protein
VRQIFHAVLPIRYLSISASTLSVMPLTGSLVPQVIKIDRSLGIRCSFSGVHSCNVKRITQKSQCHRQPMECANSSIARRVSLSLQPSLTTNPRLYCNEQRYPAAESTPSCGCFRYDRRSGSPRPLIGRCEWWPVSSSQHGSQNSDALVWPPF